jgi:hypothetical protein
MTQLAQLMDAPVPKKKGTPATAPAPTTLKAPRYCLRKRREALKLTPLEVWEILVKTLLPSMQEAIESLSYQLVKQVEEQDLLAGYSASAVAAGCMQFAACALETEIQFSRKKLHAKGLKANAQAIRCAYNALWRERRRFETVLEEQGTSLEALNFPIAPDGSVSRRILRADSERERGEVEQQEASNRDEDETDSSMEERGTTDYDGEETYSLMEESWAHFRRPSTLTIITSVSDTTALMRRQDDTQS